MFVLQTQVIHDIFLIIIYVWRIIHFLFLPLTKTLTLGNTIRSKDFFISQEEIGDYMEDQVYSEIGKRIREGRDTKGWTQQELSDRMELTRSSIANIELGRQKIQVHVLYTFAEVLGLNPLDLLPQPSVIKNKEKYDSNLDTESRDFLQRILEKSSHTGGDE